MYHEVWVSCPDCGRLFKVEDYLRGGEKKILDALENGPQTFSELKRETSLASVSLSENIKRLYKKGWITHDYLTKLYQLQACSEKETPP